MKRWHSEQDLMLRRWRMELASHANQPRYSLAPTGLAQTIECHCANGIGTMRKHRPLICEIPHCFCRDPKHLRAADRKRAVAKWQKAEDDSVFVHS